MPKGYPLTACKICGEAIGHRSELTARGKHIDCSTERMAAEQRQLADHHGPFFDWWRRRCREAFLNAPLDAPRV